jgi:oligoribonuclease (3'-5' exoribonuclease)
MRYVSIDIETLGLDPFHDDVVEFAAVIDDFKTSLEKLPKYHCYVTRPDNNYCGNAYAMSMHPVILRRIATREAGFSYMPHDCLVEDFALWLADNGLNDKIVVAGKNFAAFDKPFLLRLGFGIIKFCHRSLDPGSMYFDPKIDMVPPDTKECLIRAGITTEVAHTAYEDALDVVRLIRHKYRVPVIKPAAEYRMGP